MCIWLIFFYDIIFRVWKSKTLKGQTQTQGNSSNCCSCLQRPTNHPRLQLDLTADKISHKFHVTFNPLLHKIVLVLVCLKLLVLPLSALTQVHTLMLLLLFSTILFLSCDFFKAAADYMARLIMVYQGFFSRYAQVSFNVTTKSWKIQPWTYSSVKAVRQPNILVGFRA